MWHVEIAAIDDKSGPVILHSNAKGQLTVRDAGGNVLARYSPEVYLAHFSLSAWTDDPHVNKIIAADEGFVYVLTSQGKTVVCLPIPGNAGIAEPRATRVDFSEGAPYYVALLRHSLWPRSLVYVYDAQNRLVYNEILDHDCDALHAVQGSNSGEDLLLGCDGMVWKYSLRR